jgi:hypothetical protein
METMLATASKESNSAIFTIESEQRNALLSREHNQSELQLMFRSFKDVFQDQGYILVRGLLDDSVLQRLCNVGHAMSAGGKHHSDRFSTLEFGPIFSAQETVFREAALNSAIPAVIAALLGIDDKGVDSDKSPLILRLLKDAFLAKGKEENHCGWHVDDCVFWPTDANSCGVNVWIALDNMPAKYGGGLALSPKSHKAEWKHKAYESIGSTPTLSAEGVNPKIMTFSTCEIASVNQELNDVIEATKLVFDYQAGDCLFCHRWLFHRSVPINPAGLDFYKDGSSLSRYTVRYERGNAKLIPGFSLEPCVLMNTENSAKSLDEVCARDGPFYPQCWPPLEEKDSHEQESKMEMLARDILPVAMAKKSEIMKELFMAKASGNKPSYSS